VKSNGFELDALLSYPFTQGFSVFGRVGVQNAKSTVNLTGAGSVVVITPQTSETKTSWDAGVGLGYEFTTGLGLRAEWQRYRVPDGTNTGTMSDVDVVGASIYYKF
jgi:OOP family OmpA-OmpF porin